MSFTTARYRGRAYSKRRGASLVFMVFLMTIVTAAVAFSVDVGRIFVLRSQVQTAVDAAAIAASLKLAEDSTATEEAAAAAREFVQRNRAGTAVTIPENAIVVEIGEWDSDTGVFSTSSTTPNAVRVSARQENEPFYFARLFGETTFSAPAFAVATGSGGPLDIMLALDLSGSMSSNGRIEALRNAVPEFVDVIEEAGGEDQIGMMGYGVESDDFDPDDHGDGTPYTQAPSELFQSGDDWVAVLEADLTDNFTDLTNNALSSSNLTAQKYGGGTPIGAGIRDAAHYLENSVYARETVNNIPVQKVIVLMSDGHANKPSGDGSGYALDMADYAALLDIKVYTISLGNSADEDLMEEIADRTGARHFDATGSGEEELTEVLTQAFRSIGMALKRPQLVQ